MPNNQESRPSFWSTLPGILTALGAIIAASAGLITTLYSVGVIGNKNKPPDKSPVVSNTNLESPSNTSRRFEPNSPSNNLRTPEQPSPTEASRDFMIGRWQVEQASGEVSGGSLMDYEENGTFTGSMTVFVNGSGQKQSRTGSWDVQKLSKDTFRLRLEFDDDTTWVGKFKIIDADRIHNIDQNYIAVRSK
jgi:hypothetical protein